MKIYLKKCSLLQTIVFITAFSMMPSLYAVEVQPGGVAQISGTTHAQNNDLGGGVQRDSLIPFQIKDNLGNIILEGKVQDRVVRSRNTNKLIFAPRLRDLSSPNGTSWVSAVRLEGFGGYTTDIDFRTDGSGDIGSNEVSRSTGSGDKLDFKYDPNLIEPPKEAKFLSVITNAQEFCTNGTITIYAQNDFGASVFSTTLENTASPDQSGSDESCNTPRVSSNLDIKIPSANLVTKDERLNIWINFEYKHIDSDGDHVWKLNDVGVNSSSGIVGPSM